MNNSHLGSAVSVRRKVSVTDCARRLLYMKWLLCKQAKQLEPSLHCLRLHRGAGREAEVQYVAPAELLGHAVREAKSRAWRYCRYLRSPDLTNPDLLRVTPQVNDEWEVVPANVFTLRISKLVGSGDYGESVTPRVSWSFF